MRQHNYDPEFLHTAFDGRIGCRYILFTLTSEAFLYLVKQSYSAKGAIEGQREAMRTTTAARIRARMVEDLRLGAVIPPIVLGSLCPDKQLKQSSWSNQQINALLNKSRSALSIIDGIQRTTALSQAVGAEQVVRVELWLSPSMENLIYRMLVLNTGQLPWNLRRQLEVVNRGLISEIQEALPEVVIHRLDDKKRRTSDGEFQANDVIEMYLAFKLRKPHVDKEQVLSDSFSKLDLIESVSVREGPVGLLSFVEALSLLADLDAAFSRLRDGALRTGSLSGRAVFDKVSACVGFMSAYAQFVFGKVGMDRDSSHVRSQSIKAKKSVGSIVSRLRNMPSAQIGEFLALDVLAEVSQKKAGSLSIGEQERELFLSAFRLALEEGPNLTSMVPCWRSQ
jgi:hypothetical protein